MIDLAFVVIGVVGCVVGVIVIQLAVADQARMAREVRADLAEIEAAREAEGIELRTPVPPPLDPGLTDPIHRDRITGRPLPPYLAGQVLDDSHAPGWEPISPDLIA